MSNLCCKDCEWWDEYGMTVGLCRANAPRQVHSAFMSPTEGGKSFELNGVKLAAPNPYDNWPSTSINDFCGDFERRKAESE